MSYQSFTILVRDRNSGPNDSVFILIASHEIAPVTTYFPNLFICLNKLKGI